MSIAQLAKSLSAPRSSVQWVVSRYCSDEEQSAIVVERRHTKKDKITRVTKEIQD
jgi:prophage tail gpP-like protein